MAILNILHYPDPRLRIKAKPIATVTHEHRRLATDMLESMGQELTTGDNFHICVHLESEAEADRVFEALAEKGKIKMPINKTFWGAYFGMCRDRFNIPRVGGWTSHPSRPPPNAHRRWSTAPRQALRSSSYDAPSCSSTGGAHIPRAR